MDFKSLNIIKEIYETQNITAASHHLFMTQPTLTYHIKRLEKSLGFPILLRNPKGVTFTDKGILLAHFAQKTLQDWENMTNTFSTMEEKVNKPLRLGISSVISTRKFPALLKKYRDLGFKQPFNIFAGSSTLELPQLLKREELDIAIIRGEFSWDGPKISLKEEPYYLLSHNKVEMEDLPHIPWIRFKPSKITKSEILLNNWWHSYFKNKHEQIIQLDTIEAALQMVRYSLGWCVVPEIHLQNAADGLYFTPIKLKDGHFITRKTTLAYQKDVIKNKEAINLISFLKENY